MKIYVTLPGLLIALMLAGGCQKQSTAPPKDVDEPALSLPGSYTSSSASVTLSLTTASDQRANDILNPGTGEIAVNGAHDALLKYLLPVEESSASILLASDKPQLLSLLAAVYPEYRLTLIDILGFVKMASFTVKFSARDSVNYYGSYNRFDYDAAARTLSADSVYYYTTDSSAYVLFNGSLTAPVIDIPAETPTPVLYALIPAAGIGTLTLNGDSSFSAAASYEGTGDSLSGRWHENGPGRLLFIYDPETGEAPDSLEAAYTLTASGLTLEIAENAAPYLGMLGLQDAVPLLEIALGVDHGSIRDIDIEAVVHFTESQMKPPGIQPQPNTLPLLKPSVLIETLASLGRTLKNLTAQK